MNEKEFADAKVLWQMFYAEQCFRRARETAEYVYTAQLENNNPLFYPLVAAVHILYGKPFTHWHGIGALEERMVPKDRVEYHRLIMTHRHKIYAHTDANAFDLGNFGAPSQVRVRRIREGNAISTQLFGTDFYSRFTAMPTIIDLCKVLEEKANYHVRKQWNKHKGKIPVKQGEFVLNVLMENRDMWLPEKPLADY